MLAGLMAGVLVKPVLAFAGDMHEAEHAGLVEDDQHGHGDDTPDPIDPSDAKNPWHSLMHFGQCCGQTPAVLPLVQPGSILPVVTAPLPPWSAAFKPASHPVDLRPPITT